MKSLITHYLEQVECRAMIKDPAQIHIVEKLQRLFNDMHNNCWRPGFLKKHYGFFLWGNVGTGKSWLMELFYQSVRSKKKCRYHYHEFMAMLHERMLVNKNKANPLKLIAQQLAREYHLICIDEFNVPEIADAMLLSGVLQGLFEHKVILLSTSNYAPDKLYENGFQREMFLPAIELIKRHNEVIEINSSVDYRIHNSMNSTSIEHLSQHINEAELNIIFQRLMKGDSWNCHEIMLNKRPLSVIKAADGVVWLDYAEICGDPRATCDYIELSRLFPAVIISNIDVQLAARESYACRFLHFVDELYEQQTRVVVSALGNVFQEHHNKALSFQLSRALSRLYEMQGLMIRMGYISAA